MTLEVKVIENMEEIEGFDNGFCHSCGHSLEIGQEVCLETTKGQNGNISFTNQKVVYCDGCNESKKNNVLVSKSLKLQRWMGKRKRKL